MHSKCSIVGIARVIAIALCVLIAAAISHDSCGAYEWTRDTNAAAFSVSDAAVDNADLIHFVGSGSGSGVTQLFTTYGGNGGCRWETRALQGLPIDIAQAHPAQYARNHGYHASVACDASGRVHCAYLVKLNGNNYSIWYTNGDLEGLPSSSSIPESLAVAGFFPTAIKVSADGNTIHIAYVSPSGHLIYARKASGSAWVIDFVPGPSGQFGTSGRWGHALLLDSAGKAHFLFAVGSTTQPTAMCYQNRSSNGSWSSMETVVTDVCSGPALALAANGDLRASMVLGASTRTLKVYSRSSSGWGSSPVVVPAPVGSSWFDATSLATASDGAIVLTAKVLLSSEAPPSGVVISENLATQIWDMKILGTTTTTTAQKVFAAGQSKMIVCYSGDYYERLAGTPDAVAPNRVVDLYAVASGANGVVFNWSAPGDDGSQGNAYRYDLRYSYTQIYEAGQFASMASLPVSKTPCPSPSGAGECWFVPTGCGDQVWVALTARDNAGNISAVSNWSSPGSVDG